MKQTNSIFLMLMITALTACGQANEKARDVRSSAPTEKFLRAKPDSYWKNILSPEAYGVMVKKGTERPYDNPYHDNNRKGIYDSAAAGQPLFASAAKFDSGAGWQSFFEPLDEEEIMIVKDTFFGTVREGVLERSTGLHLGHVFDDGPVPTGKRYCMTSYALKFIPSKK